MGFNLSKNSGKPFLIAHDGIIVEANKEFTEFTGFSAEELLGKSLLDIGDILRINSQIFLDHINNNYSGFIFTKSLEAREVDISLCYYQERNEKKYVFTEKPNSRLNEKIILGEQLFDGNIVGVTVFSAPGLILLKSSHKYLDFLDAPYNLIENYIGKPAKEIIPDFAGNQSEEYWNCILQAKECLHIKEFKIDSLSKGTTYWDATYLPVFENGTMKYIIEYVINVTERVLKIQYIEAQNKIIQKQKEELEEKAKIIELQTEELKQQNAQLVSIVENIPSGIYISYLDGRMIHLNEASKKIAPVMNKTMELGATYKHTHTEFFTTNGQPIGFEKAPAYRALKGEKVKNERIISKQSGKELILDISSSPVYDASGNVIMAITCAHDVTELVNINTKIQQQKGQLEVVIDNIHEEIYIIDRNGNYIMLNDSARQRQRINNCKIENIYDDFNSYEYFDLSGKRLDKIDMPITKLMNGEGLKDYMMIVHDPSKRYICCNGSSFFDLNGAFSIGVISIRDVTSDVLHKQSTERELGMLTKLVKNLDLPVIRMSYPELNIIDINQKAYKHLKTINPTINSIYDVIGNNYCKFFFNTDDDYDLLNYIRGEVKKNEIPYIKQRKHIILGDERYVTILYQPIVGDNGEVEELVGIVFDVTSEVKANSQMQKTLKMQEEFFANISHELKTPINVIYSTVQLFQMYCCNGSLDEKRDSFMKHLDSIKRNTYRLSKLVNNIVDISKIESGYLELQISNNNIVELVEDIVMSVADYTVSKGINIIFDTDIEEKMIGCDPEKIERIVLNLISNAIKFSYENDEILISVKDKGEFVEISVKDNGIGIEDRHLNMIFDRFKQVDKSLSRNAEGTGIGLSLVKSIVELHNGHIFVESQLGKGSKFTVVLPAKKVIHENILPSNKIRNRSESIQLELSDVSS